MQNAVIYARVSSKDQEREGYSIPAQLKLLREYAQKNDLSVLHEFVDVETAKMAGRKNFGAMVKYLEKSPNCRVVLAEKTDRLYRNLRDCLTLEDLDLEIHLPKEGQVVSKNARSQAKLIHGIHVVLARNYIENLREEVKKGMREKAEQGIYPSRPPLGYRNNKLEHTIEVDPENALIAKRMFELYSSGQYSLQEVWKALKREFDVKLSKSHVEKLLKNPFYTGAFCWDGKLYAGTHTPLISQVLFDQVQAVFRGHNQPKYKKHEFAYGGLLRCAYDDCMVTAELKKNRYTYYRCTGYRGKCDLPYFREEKLGEQLGQILKDIHIPNDILKQLERAMLSDKGRAEACTKADRDRLESKLLQIRRRIDQAYLDKLDGKISEAFWEAKSTEWNEDQQRILAALETLKLRSQDGVQNGLRILELANKAYFLYLRQPPAEKAKLLRIVLSNCKVDAVSVYPTYRKPFDLIFNRVKTKEWLPGIDSN
jgi:DNA invertase Pin-like site-specific DNA recombinase